MIRLVLKGNDFQRWIDLFNYLFNYGEILFLQMKRETIRNFVLLNHAFLISFTPENLLRSNPPPQEGIITDQTIFRHVLMHLQAVLHNETSITRN